MIVCPWCKTAEHVQIDASGRGEKRWSARCEVCDQAWTFEDA